YQISDGQLTSNLATVTITVNFVNDRPVANPDAFTTDEDTPLAIAAPGVLANDTDEENDPLTMTGVTGPANGTLTLNANGSFTYTRNAGATGPDSFTYTAYDGISNSNVATVRLNVAPVGVADAYATAEDTMLTVPAATGVLANDTDSDGDTLSGVFY